MLIDHSKMRVGMSDIVSSVLDLPRYPGWQMQMIRPPNAMLSFELSIEKVENKFLRIDSNTITNRCPAHVYAAPPPPRKQYSSRMLILSLQLNGQPASSEQYQGQPSSLENVAAPSFPPIVYIIAGRMPRIMHSEFLLLRGR